ncbi:AMP-binding protein [bacterium]|nr:AMP-binding protein [bacterium]
MNNLYCMLEKSCEKHGNKSAIIFGNHSISYKDLIDACDRFACALQEMELGPGDRIALMLPNVPHFIISYFAILKIGAIIVPISIFDKANEIHHQLEDSEAKGIIYWDQCRRTVHEAVQGLERCSKLIVLGEKAEHGEVRLPYLMEIHSPQKLTHESAQDDTALIVYTAGTTGRPKGAELTHGNIISNIESLAGLLKLKSSDHVASTIPFFFPAGQVLVIGSFLFSGATLTLSPHLDADHVISLIESQKPSYFVSYPSLLQELLNITEEALPDFSCLDYWITSGDAIKADVMKAFESRFKIPILESYGLTEASSVVSMNVATLERKPGSIGLPLPGVEIKIVNHQDEEVMSGEVGEIIVQGPNIMKGYLNRPEATKEAIRNGWLYTGDLAQFDESGYGLIVARKKNVIMKSGFSVYPTEVEKCLVGHPKVKEAVVVGLPDNLTGEEIHAGVVLKGNETATPAEIIDYTKERMAAYKCPKTVFFLLSLSKGPGGRIMRDQVKQILQDKMNQHL